MQFVLCFCEILGQGYLILWPHLYVPDYPTLQKKAPEDRVARCVIVKKSFLKWSKKGQIVNESTYFFGVRIGL